MRQAEIEAKDERNVAIRRRAQAVSGEVLQWAVMAAAWLAIGLGAPLWVTLAAVGVFLAKSVLELCLMGPPITGDVTSNPVGFRLDASRCRWYHEDT